MDYIGWCDTLSIGHEQIDDCHQAMLECLGKVYTSVVDNDTTLALRYVLEFLHLSTIHGKIETSASSRYCAGHDNCLDDLAMCLRTALMGGAPFMAKVEMIANLESMILAGIWSAKTPRDRTDPPDLAPPGSAGRGTQQPCHGA